MLNISRLALKINFLKQFTLGITLTSLYASTVLADITVIGVGRHEITPNIASFSAVIETKAQTANEAAVLNATQTDKTLNILKSLLNDPKAITTRSYSVYPDYKYNGQTGESSFDGFKVNNVLTVKSYSIKEVGKLLDNTIQSGVTRVEDLSFSYDKPEEIYQQSLKLAIDNAKQRADVLAKASNLQVTKVATVKLSNFEFTPQPRYMISEMAMAKSAGADTQITAPDISSEAIVEVVFETQNN